MIESRMDIINYLVKNNGYRSYLEIGVSTGKCFEKIECELKHSVDPSNQYAKVNYNMTSDDFFAQNENFYDLIFIDGLHVNEQVEKDILNGLKFLNKNGTIVCHDINADRDYRGGISNGDCWRAWIKIRRERDDLIMNVVDKDCGCGIIQVGASKKLVVDGEIDWQTFDRNRREYLPLISSEQFLEIY